MRVLDAGLCVCFALFAFTSFVYEPYVTFAVDLREATDPIGRSWFWYADSFDPLFLDTPLWLRIMCTIDFIPFGCMHLFSLYCFLTRWEAVRSPGLLYAGALFYSTLVYFGYEFIAERDRADLLWMFLINVPYTIMPLVLAWRLWGTEPLWDDAEPRKEVKQS